MSHQQETQDVGRLVQQAHAIEAILREAGIGAMSLPAGVQALASALSALQAQQDEMLRATLTNEVIRAVCALARQQTVCREQAGQVVFVTGMEAAREYLLEQLASAEHREKS